MSKSNELFYVRCPVCSGSFKGLGGHIERMHPVTWEKLMNGLRELNKK